MFNSRFPALLSLVFILLMLGCRQKESPESVFIQPESETPIPRTGTDFDNNSEDFRFAIFSDLTGGERQGVFEVATEQLNLLQPELIMNVGDLIEGAHANRDSLLKEWQIFDRHLAKLDAPVFYTGGNHDLTGEVLREFWRERYGSTYYHFIYKNVLFLVLDTEDLPQDKMAELIEARDAFYEVLESNPEAIGETKYMNMPEQKMGGISKTQSEYFQEVLAENTEVKWTFLFMHKPVWMDSTETAYKDIEESLSGRKYTVFNGHLHSFSHQVRNGADHTVLATTGGYQNPEDPKAFDQLSMVTMQDGGPVITHFRMNGILDKTGMIPAGGDTLCFQASASDCQD